MMKKILLTIFLYIIFCIVGFAKEQKITTISDVDSLEVTKLRASIYLNECAYSLTRILRSGNKIVMEDEQYKLNNVYKWENITEYSSVLEFRKMLQTHLNDLIINETNRERFKNAFERKKNAAARDALLGVISGVQFNVNVTSIVSNVLLSSARAYLDYGKRKEDMLVELDEQVWQLEQGHMNSITLLRNELFNVINQTFGEYKISDQMYLREKHFEDFYNILSNQDPVLKMAALNDNMKTFQSFPPYWFELGCTYLDNYENENNVDYLNNAWECFSRYEKMNKDCPMFLVDGRIGMIALYKLKYYPNLSKEEIISLIEIAKENIDKDASALLYAAMQYDILLSSPDESLNMMRQCLDNQSLTGKNEFILAATSIWDKVSSIDCKEMFVRAVYNASNIDLDTYVSFLSKVINDKDVDAFPLMNRLQTSFNINVRSYDDNFPEKIEIICDNNNNISYNLKNWGIVLEERNIISGLTQVYTTTLNFAEPKLFYSKLEDFVDEIKSENKYFKKHQNDIEKVHLVSKVELNQEDYYYLSHETNWNSIKNQLTYINDNSDAEKYDKTANVENEYTDFYNEYSVKNIKYEFLLNEPKEEKLETIHNEPRYTIKIKVSSLDNAGITFVFTTDYIQENKTTFYFSGIEYYNKEYMRF